MSCRTKESRSAGVNVWRTTRSASPTDSAISASCSGSPSVSTTIGSGSESLGSSRRARSTSRQTRPTTVVSQPRRFSIASASERVRRSHASWTASSASLADPSIRYATARRCGLACSNCSARWSRSFTSHPLVGFRHSADVRRTADVTKEERMIEVTQLRKVYPGDVEAVKGMDFEVARGEIFGLLGPNGAGKSTTIGMLTTSIRPSGGTARVGGFDVAERPLAARKVSSVVFQEPVVDRALSGRANLELHARLWRVEPRVARARIADLSVALGVADLLDRPVAGYSGGERGRLEIARALLSQPRARFLDEPAVGLGLPTRPSF